MEPEWMKQIPSSAICNFFYFFFVVYAVIFVLSVVTVIGTALSMKSTPMLVPLLANGILTSVIGGTMMLFYYLICDRALLATKTSTSTPASAF